MAIETHKGRNKMNGQDEKQPEAHREVNEQVFRLSNNADALSEVAQRLYEKVKSLLNESDQKDSGDTEKARQDDAVCPLAAEIRCHNERIEGSKGKINSIINRIEIN